MCVYVCKCVACTQKLHALEDRCERQTCRYTICSDDICIKRKMLILLLLSSLFLHCAAVNKEIVNSIHTNMLSKYIHNNVGIHLINAIFFIGTSLMLGPFTCLFGNTIIYDDSIFSLHVCKSFDPFWFSFL